jgi:hypothetical protein
VNLASLPPPHAAADPSALNLYVLAQQPPSFQLRLRDDVLSARHRLPPTDDGGDVVGGRRRVPRASAAAAHHHTRARSHAGAGARAAATAIAKHIHLPGKRKTDETILRE